MDGHKMSKAPTKASSVPATIKAPQLPANTDDDFSAYAGAGLEEVKAKDLLIPRLTLLQALSPQLNKKKPEFVEGAELGDICDTGTGEVFKTGVVFLPALFTKNYLEWFPRDSGKGLAMIHTDPAILDKCRREDRGPYILPNGNYVNETANFFGLNLTAGRRWCFVPMTSTQLQKARRWLTMATSEKLKRADGSEFVAPIWYRCYSLTSAEQSNAQGDWAGWKIERAKTIQEMAELLGIPFRTLKDEVLALAEAVKSGLAHGDVSEMQGEHAAASDKDAM